MRYSLWDKQAGEVHHLDILIQDKSSLRKKNHTLHEISLYFSNVFLQVYMKDAAKDIFCRAFHPNIDMLEEYIQGELTPSRQRGVAPI